MSSVQVDDTKPWWQNTGLLMTLVPAIVGLLKIFGFVGADNTDTVNELIKNLVETGVLFGAAIMAGVQWFKQQTTVTLEKMSLQKEELKLQTEQLRAENLRMSLRAKE